MTEFESNDMIIAPTSEPPNILFWRIGSVVGVAIVLLVALIQSFSAQPLQYRSLFWLMAAAVLLPIAIRFVFPVSWQALFRNPDLLIPFGIAWVVSKALAWLTLLPLLGGLLSTGWSGAVFGLSLSGSIFTIFYMLVWSGYASWQIELIWQWVRHDRIVEISPWPCIRKGFWRALCVLVLGHGVLLLALIPVLAITTALGPVGLIGFMIIGIVWNLLTVALMPIALSDSHPFIKSLTHGFRTSWSMKRNWWIQLGVQLILLGIITYVLASYHDGTSFHSTSSFTITAFWVGAFENQSRWHSQYMAIIKTNPLPFAVAMLEALFILLAVSMKIHVMKKLQTDARFAK